MPKETNRISPSKQTEHEKSNLSPSRVTVYHLNQQEMKTPTI